MPFARLRTLTSGPALVLLLIALMAGFAVLQYRWLGQVSQADREQMRQSVNDRTRQFAAALDKDVATAQKALTFTAPLDERAGAQMATQFAEWQAAAQFPRLVSAVYVTSAPGSDVLHRF